MTNPIDAEIYEDAPPPSREEVEQGNTGHPQSEFEGLGEDADSSQDPPGDADPDDASQI